MPAVEIAPEIIATVFAEARAAAPHECCGLLLGHRVRITTAIPARNVHPTPQTHFEIDPQALIDAHRAARSGGPLVLGYYHSHPSGPALPSATDQAMAHGDGMVWAIAGRDEITFWRDDRCGFTRIDAVSGLSSPPAHG